jgi:hypothetical protein
MRGGKKRNTFLFYKTLVSRTLSITLQVLCEVMNPPSQTCEKRLDCHGRSQWSFIEDAGKTTEDTNYFPCTIQETSSKGLGVFCRRADVIEGGSKVVSEPSFACLPTGKHRARVCHNCLKFGHKKVKVSDDCPEFYFCSHECLHSMDDLTTECGPLITQVLCALIFLLKKQPVLIKYHHHHHYHHHRHHSHHHSIISTNMNLCSVICTAQRR